MGLDMMLFRIKRYKDATLSDVFAVQNWLDLQEYKKEHPEYNGTMKDWCGVKTPAKSLINFYSDKRAEEVAYWRKANEIHAWFVKHIQDGEDDCDVHREVTKEDLQELLETVKTVQKNPLMADELLPTRSGFFFGGTEYDRWYFEDLRSTVEQVEKVLAETDFENEALYYISSW